MMQWHCDAPWCPQDIHGQLLSSSVREGMSAAQLALPVKHAAFMEVADCFAAMLPDPQVRFALP